MEEEYTQCITTSPQAPPEDVQIQRGNEIHSSQNKRYCGCPIQSAAWSPLTRAQEYRYSKLMQLATTCTELKKSFRYIFLQQIERKRSEEYLVIILDVEKKNFERFSCLKIVFKKSRHREAGLKHKLKL